MYTAIDHYTLIYIVIVGTIVQSNCQRVINVMMHFRIDL